MGYYLSKKNEKIILPYLEILLQSNKDVYFSTNRPDKLIYLLRQAVNTSYPQLKDFYKFHEREGKVYCEHLHLQVELEITNIVSVPSTLYDAAQAIMENNTPIIFEDITLTEEDMEALHSLASSKSLSLNSYPPKLEIK